MASTDRSCVVTAVVLAGGLGRRMGHRDKGLLPLAGRPLVAWVIRAIAPQVSRLYLNSDNPQYAHFGYETLIDPLPGRPGPLAGMLAGLEGAKTPFVLTVPCDTPRLPTDLVARLCAGLQDADADIAIAHDGNRAHPVVALVRRTLAPALRAYLEAGNRRVYDWVRAQRHVEVDFSDEADTFENINTAGELQRMVGSLHQRALWPFPILGIAAFSGTGKTTLLEQLIPALGQRQIRVALIKHAHHRFDIDTPGKDSYRLRKAGASQVLVASRHRWALMTELDEALAEPPLAALLSELDPARFDLVLVEGFKHERIPKLELHRPALGKPRLYPDDPDVIALATDAPPSEPIPIPLLDINDIEAIADFVAAFAAAKAGEQTNGTESKEGP